VKGRKHLEKTCRGKRTVKRELAMNGRRSVIEQELGDDVVDTVIDKYRGREIEFFMERGRKYPEKLEEIFHAVANGTHDEVVVRGCRGGGKTLVISDAATKRFRWDEWDVFHIGGSLKQAKDGYKYVNDTLTKSSDLGDSLQDNLKTAAIGPRGNWYNIAAASTKGVRGGHPGDIHPEMGNVPHGGMLVKDEFDEMDPRISEAADFSMDVAHPAMTVTTSTAHKDDGEGIQQLLEDAAARGAKVITFDAFDVTEVCTHDCAKCPGGFDFAGPMYGGCPATKAAEAMQRKRMNLQAGAIALPTATPASSAAWEAHKSKVGWIGNEPAYCAGRAKLHREGHLKVARLAQMFRKSNRRGFEIELCCRRRKGGLTICNAMHLDKCLDPDLVPMSGYDGCIVIDWGLKSQAAILAVQQQKDNTYAVIDVNLPTMWSSDSVWEHCERLREEHGFNEVFADASHPYNNLDGANKFGFQVTEVPFAQNKEFGADWVAAIVERQQLRIRGRLVAPEPGAGPNAKAERIFYSDDEETLFTQLKGWRRDAKGKIVKKNDHGCDALLQAALKFADEQPWKVECAGAGARDFAGGSRRDSDDD
jgi:hypothetical protein